ADSSGQNKARANGSIGLENHWSACRDSSRKVRKCQFESLAVAPKMYVSPCQRDTSNRASLNRAWALRTYPQHAGVEQRMKVELFQPESVTEPRHWVRHDQTFAMMLRPGSIEWGSKRTALEKFEYAPGD